MQAERRALPPGEKRSDWGENEELKPVGSGDLFCLFFGILVFVDPDQ